MFKKLDGILEKYQKLSAEMADPAVIAQTERWTQCAKEHADIAETARFAVETAKEFGRGTCAFFDPEEFERIVDRYGRMNHLQQ